MRQGGEEKVYPEVDRLIARGEAHVWWWRSPGRVDPADLRLLATGEFRRALGMLSERDAAEFVHTGPVPGVRSVNSSAPPPPTSTWAAGAARAAARTATARRRCCAPPYRSRSA
ncbi:hypothetical protein O1M54_18400 [Streptomyces diastatochromogenes]|nr:hypothetical protein [Streptomyces diastatochromogenes]